MRGRNQSILKDKRAFLYVAVIASILLFSVSLFSAFYVAAETNHDCCGEDCPICAHIDQCEAMLRSAGDAAAAAGAVLLFAAFLVTAAALSDFVPRSSSLITDKVRMNN